MCGIVGAVSKRDVVPILMEGLRRLEYRGYDSAGIAVLQETTGLKRARAEGKVSVLKDILNKDPMKGFTGIAHTRWATHGKPSERNAHPHIVGDRVVLVHNGIIENYEQLRERLNGDLRKNLLSETDSEIVACHIFEKLQKGKNILEAVKETASILEGAYAICVMDTKDPSRVIGLRSGPPLVIGLGKEEQFMASDVLALQQVTEQFMYLEDGDIAELTLQAVRTFDKTGKEVQRKTHTRSFNHDSADKAGYPHFMLKEIFEQPTAVQDTLVGRVAENKVLEKVFGVDAEAIFNKTENIQIVACGTSYHAGLIARYWIENLAGIPCQVEIASEFRYRKRAKSKNALLVLISQSGETADTLAALRNIDPKDYSGTLSICNVPDSSLCRESQLVFMTQAGPEIGVCSTKAFTSQLVALFLLSLVLGRRRGLEPKMEGELIAALKMLPKQIQETLTLSPELKKISETFNSKIHALFLGRGSQYPVALEGALKLKEISYIHAEAYPAGELKHGPLALVDKDMPIIVTAPKDALLEKIKSNIQEVRARGGELLVFSPKGTGFVADQSLTLVTMPEIHELLAPILYTIPLQLLAYHVAVLRGTDVDQPRNLAKSVTVE